MPKAAAQIQLTPVSRLRWRRASAKPERWLYLGKDVRRRLELESRWGTQTKFPLDGALHQTAASLRQPYLDLVARVGALQSDGLSWWSSRFSWKMWTTSDFFLLACYLRVGQEAARDALEQNISLEIVVEDPWLFYQLRQNLTEEAPSWLLWQKGLCLISGVARRVKWLYRTLRNARKQKKLWPPQRFELPAGPSAALFAYPQERAFRDETGWVDPYLPEVDQLLQESGLSVIRFTPPERSGFEQELAQRSKRFQPLILWVTPKMIWRSLTAFWWPRWPEQLTLDGLPVQLLCQREWWLEVSRAGLSVFRLLHESLLRMLSQGNFRCLVTFYENQPWEKMVALAAREAKVQTVAIQTSLLSTYSLSYFLGEGESDRMPLPDIICTSGEQPQRVLREGGNPPDRLRLCGSIRYPHLTQQRGSQATQALPAAPRSKVLVVLPIDQTQSEHLLKAIEQAFPDGGKSAGVTFHVRSHPFSSVQADSLKIPVHWIDAQQVPLEEDLKLCGLVLFISSTVGFEAMAQGRSVLRYRSNWLLDVDDLYGKAVAICSDDDLRDKLMAQISSESPTYPSPLVEEVFAPLNTGQLKSAFEVSSIA